MQVTDGMRAVVMGLGRFGGGAGAARWLAERGARVIVTDTADRDTLRDSIASLEPHVRNGEIELILGQHPRSIFRDADLVVANPAIKLPWSNPHLLDAREAGVPVTTEIRLLIEQLDHRRVIGVTGTAGKSTTAAMTHHLLNALGVRAHLGGNFGGSLLNRLDRIGADDLVVLELSSAMLYWLGEGIGFDDAVGWSPRIALLTNLSPNHLDWHGTMDHYRASKMNIARYHTDGDAHLLRGDAVAPVTAPAMQLAVPGEHNRRNAALALKAVRCFYEIDDADAASLLRTFKGLPHRLQVVCEIDGCVFINDSKSTTPEATLLAVAAIGDASKVHLIVGGSDKGADLTVLAHLAPRLRALYTIGAVGKRIVQHVPAESSSRVFACEVLERAVEQAIARMSPGESLLLSPGCASFDQFKNFEARGEAFMRLVRCALATRASA